MILGMPVETFTLIHVAISLLGIAAGFVVAYGRLVNKRLDAMTAFFLATTALANVTGFLFPNEHVTPGIVIGIISMVALTIAVAARYPFHLAGGWRGTYVISAMVALYLNCFVDPPYMRWLHMETNLPSRSHKACCWSSSWR